MAPRTSLSHCLSLLSDVVPQDVATLVNDLPAELILQALSATGSASIRRRKLPAEQVVWLVLGMALFRHLPIVQIVDQLGLALPKGPPLVPSAIHKARQRLGALPLLWLFEATAHRWAQDSASAHRFRGLRVYGIDGTTLRVADSPENRAHFGGTQTHRGPSGYPLVRLVALMALRSHLLQAAAFGPYDTHELGYAEPLFSQVPDESLVILDRGFFAASVFHSLLSQGTQRHFLIRTRKDLKARVMRRLGPGDELVELRVSATARRQHPELPETLTLRRVVYQRKGHRPQALLTSLLEPSAYPAPQLAALYHERWELELGFDEVKTEMLDRQESLRSKHPDAVEQEVWGVLLAYNLVRLEMERLAALTHVEPIQLSFSGTLLMLMQLWQLMSLRFPGSFVRLLHSVEAQMQRLLLPPRRSQRSYPRAVKIKMSNYDRKRPSTVRKGA